MNTATVEQWLPVVGYEDSYSVSNFGRVRSEARVIQCVNRSDFRLKQHVMTPASGKSMYLSVRLVSDAVATTRYVHHLVLEAFVGPKPSPGMDACHGDNNRKNNRADNLRWDSRSGNHADKKIHGTGTAGERHPMAKLTEAAVLQMRARRALGASITTLANEFGVTRMTAHRASTGRTWSHI